MIYRVNWNKPYPVRKSRSIPDKVVTLPGNRYYNASNVWYATDPVSQCTTDQQAESIVYTGNLGHKKSNICVHSKYRRHYSGDLSAPALTVQLRVNPTHTEYFSIHGDAAAYHTTAESRSYTGWGVLTGTAVLGGTAGQNYINDTYVSLVPDLTKFSLPNDLLDWRQLGDLAKVWRKSSSVVTNLAGARLNYKFGWVPLAGDLNALKDGVLQLAEKLQKFKSNAGKVISARKTLLNQTKVVIGDDYLNANSHLQYRGQISQKVHGYLVYQTQPMQVMSKAYETLLAMLSITGVELNPRIVWDKIPFSFVVDWFVSVGDYLNSFKHSTLELPILIEDTFLQYKEEIQINSWLKLYDDVNYTFAPSTTAGTFTKSSMFHRLPLKPDLTSFSALKTHWPSLNQAINLISLGITLNGGKVNTFTRKLDIATGKLSSYFEYH